MYKKAKWTQKILRLNTTLLLFYVDTRKIVKEIRGNIYHFVPKGGTSPTETITLVVRSLYPNLPQMGQKIYYGMLMPLHDSMPILMNFRRVLDLLAFKTKYPNVCGRVTVAGCLTFIPISCMGPKHATKDTHLIFNPFIWTVADALSHIWTFLYINLVL